MLHLLVAIGKIALFTQVIKITFPWTRIGVSQVISVVKHLPSKAGDIRDEGSIPGLEDPLEKEMATNSSILAWKTPWTEEPCGLQSMGSQRVRHD